MDSLLADQVTNSEFGDLTRFINYGETYLFVPSPDLDTKPLSASEDPTWEKQPGFTNLPDPSKTISPTENNPGIWLINLTVLVAATCLHVDPWPTIHKDISNSLCYIWHPSFGLAFPSFLQLVQTELQEACLHLDHDGNPFDIQQDMEGSNHSQ
jgi:hypothetical protein